MRDQAALLCVMNTQRCGLTKNLRLEPAITPNASLTLQAENAYSKDNDG